MKREKAFTLLETLIAVMIIGILAGIAFYFYNDTVEKAKSTEATVNVRAIREAEEIHLAERDTYIAADNIEEINKRLRLAIVPKYYEYRVVGVTDDNFIVIAKRIGVDIEKADSLSEPMVIAMDKSGIIDSGYREYIDSDGTAPGGGIDGSDTGGGGGGIAPSDGMDGSDTSGGGVGGSQGGPVTVVSSSPAYNSDIEDALSMLQESQTGLYYYNLIQEKQISVIYYNSSDYPEVSSDTLGFWHGISYNTIYINEQLRLSSPESAIAAIICHEATHADYDYYPQKWIDYTLKNHPALTEDELHISGNSIDQEYNAFYNGVNTWKELKNRDTDSNMDAWEAIYDQGEEYMKEQIRIAYQDEDLPEF